MDRYYSSRGRNYKLLVWEGDYGLGFINSSCLRTILYIKMTGAPVSIETGRNPIFYQGSYTKFASSDVLLTKFEDIVTYLRSLGYNLDYNLTPKKCSESYALTSMVKQYMTLILEYVCWLDTENYYNLTARWHILVIPTPLNYIYITWRKNIASSIMEIAYPSNEEIDSLKSSMYITAASIFSILATRLGTNEYFGGSHPCSLDATVFGYLAPLLFIPLPSSEVPNLLRAWPVLVDFVTRVKSRYCSDVQFDCKHLQRTTTKRKILDTRWIVENDVLCAGICLTVFAIWFAASRNVFKVGLIMKKLIKAGA